MPTYKPIRITNLSLSFPHKTCFEGFSAQIHHGSRIAIIGRNGSGKSTILRTLAGVAEPTDGQIQMPDDAVIGYVPQLVEEFDDRSGAQRFNEALTNALNAQPNVLLLDEPTNHLDASNRRSLMRMLRAYSGTLIIVSHDTELLRCCIDTLWQIEPASAGREVGRIHIFHGRYDDYLRERQAKRASIEHELAALKRQKQETHDTLMKEQKRASKRKAYGEKKYAGDKLSLRAAQGRGEMTHNRNKQAIGETKNALIAKLSELRLPEVIVPTFSLTAAEIGNRPLVSIVDGAVSYASAPGLPVVRGINITLASSDRVAIRGDNGSGKSTIIKAILARAETANQKHSPIITAGNWQVPKLNDIGYLDQHYSTLDPTRSVFETIAELVPAWSHAEVRCHLNMFLFRKNEEVNAKTNTLSGGERARLSLAQIAAHTPLLLILDEITNNLDLETLAHVTQVLNAYPGAMIVISHDANFLQAIGISRRYEVSGGAVTE